MVESSTDNIFVPKAQSETGETHDKKEGEKELVAQGHDGGGGGPRDKRARLVALVAAFITWLLSDKLGPLLLKSIIAGQVGSLGQKASQVGSRVKKANQTSEWCRQGGDILDELGEALREEKISTPGALADALHGVEFSGESLDVPDDQFREVVQGTVASVVHWQRVRAGLDVTLESCSRPPEANGWLLVFAKLARNAFARSVETTQPGKEDEADKLELDAHGIWWIIEAAGGLPTAADDVNTPSLEGVVEDADRFSATLTRNELPPIFAMALAEEVLRPMWEADLPDGERIYAALRPRVQLALQCAWARQAWITGVMGPEAVELAKANAGDANSVPERS